MSAYQTDNPHQETGKRISEEVRYQKSRQFTTLIFFIIIVIGVYLYSSVTGSGAIEVAVDAQTLGVAGPDKYTHFIALSDITQVELIEEFDVGEAIEEAGTDKTRVGTYRNDLLGEYGICAYQACTSVIAIYTEDEIFVVNGSSESATQTYYETITEAVAAAQ